MEIIKFDIDGPVLIKNKRIGDERGFFTERFRKDVMSSHGLPTEFCQENYSRSAPGVLRGLHFQFNQPQGKLVTCVRGSIFDVAVDIRKGSSTFGKHISVVLSGDEPSWFWIPYGFAHGFCVLGDEPADLLYKVDNYYNASGEGGIKWNDPGLGIQWPLTNPQISARDAQLVTLAEFGGL